jgi:hypothetical protein
MSRHRMSFDDLHMDGRSDKSGSDTGSTGSSSKLTQLWWQLTKPKVMHGAPETLVDFDEVRVDFAKMDEEGELEEGDLDVNWATIDILSKSNNADVAANPPRASPCLAYNVSLTDPRGSDLSLVVSMPDKNLPFCEGEEKVFIDLNVRGLITLYRNVVVRFNGDTIKEYNAPAKKSKPDVDPRWATVEAAQEPEEKNENKLKPACDCSNDDDDESGAK